MAKLRWRGDYEAEIRILGVTVKPGEVVEVDDELINADGLAESGGYTWPESLWSVVAAPVKSSKSSAASGSPAPVTTKKGD